MPEKSPVIGAAPEGASDTRAAARAVREMFTSIAPRYDLLNHVLSLNVDRLWWRRASRTFRHVLARPNARVLDLCCGTGDMAFALMKQAGKAAPKVAGADFSHAMLQRASAKSLARSSAAPVWIEADALNLPFPDAQFDLVTSAFGFRNLADYDAGLREIVRVLRPEQMRHFGFWRAEGSAWNFISHLFQGSASADRYRDIRRSRSVRVSSGFGRAISITGRNVGTNEGSRILRRTMDAVYLWNRGPLSRQEITDLPICTQPASRKSLLELFDIGGRNITNHVVAKAVLRPGFKRE